MNGCYAALDHGVNRRLFLSPAMSRSAPRFRDVIGRAHFPALDGLRAVAVLVVIVGHAYPNQMPADLGVDAFFVLSGFLITRLLVREHVSAGTISLGRFYARRTIRIFPAYYAFLAVNFVLDAVRGQRWSTALLVSGLTYTVNYYNAFNHHPSTSIAHAWSLGIEEQFYLLWPFAFLLLAREGRRALLAGAAVFALAAVSWRSFLTANGADVAYLYNAFDTRFDNLAVGCILALAADSPRVASAAEALAKRVWYPVVTVAVLLMVRTMSPAWLHYSLGFTMYAVLVAILIAQLMQVYASPLWSWLEHPVTRYLGRISYPMYLYHGFGFTVARHTVQGQAADVVVAILATIALATGSYYVIERPFLTLKHRFASPRGNAEALLFTR